MVRIYAYHKEKGHRLARTGTQVDNLCLDGLEKPGGGIVLREAVSRVGKWQMEDQPRCPGEIHRSIGGARRNPPTPAGLKSVQLRVTY